MLFTLAIPLVTFFSTNLGECSSQYTFGNRKVHLQYKEQNLESI